MAGPFPLRYGVKARQRCRASFDVFTMKTLAMPAFPGGSPFASAVDRALWELGYPNDFETEAEARAAVAELRRLPAFADTTFTFVEA